MVSARTLYWVPYVVVSLVSDAAHARATSNHQNNNKHKIVAPETTNDILTTTNFPRTTTTNHHETIVADHRSRTPIPLHICGRLRGGSTQVSSAPSSSSCEIRQYQIEQHLLLQSRGVLLRQALIDRGLSGLAFVAAEEKMAQPVDWECATSTAEHPKSCLYSFDAEHGSKVVAPRDTTQWITLAALNRLRRTDPTKVEPLWHDKYSILKTWFAPSPYSFYTYLSPRAAMVSLVLDAAPWITGFALMGVGVLAFLITFPLWEYLMTNFLTSGLLWMQWPQWGRFVHAAFPLKLLLAQMAWKFFAGAFGRLYGRVRNYLIEVECELWERCIPRTIIEDAEGKEDKDEDDTAEEDEEDEEELDLR